MFSEGESTEHSCEDICDRSPTWKVRKGSKVISRVESNVIKAYSSKLPTNAPPARPQTAVPRRRRPSSCLRRRTQHEHAHGPRGDQDTDRGAKRPKSARVRSRVSQRVDVMDSRPKRKRAPLSMKEIRNVRLELDNFVGHFTARQEGSKEFCVPIKLPLLRRVSSALAELERDSKCKAIHAAEVRRAEKEALETTERQLRRFVREPQDTGSEAVQQNESYQQANLWLEQCRALADVVMEQRQSEQSSSATATSTATAPTSALNSTMLCASAAAILGGIAQSFAQACEDGNRTATETIQELHARLNPDADHQV